MAPALQLSRQQQHGRSTSRRKLNRFSFFRLGQIFKQAIVSNFKWVVSAKIFQIIYQLIRTDGQRSEVSLGNTFICVCSLFSLQLFCYTVDARCINMPYLSIVTNPFLLQFTINM